MKTDLKKTFKELYTASAKTPALVEVPRFQFLMVDGAGDPNANPFFQEAAAALFSLSYTLKFTLKKERGLDYAVMPLEGLWYADDMAAFSMDRKEDWKWTLMILQPDFITSELVSQAAQINQKRPIPHLEKVRLTPFYEGLGAQALHVGPYCDEGPTIARLHQFIKDRGFQLGGRHHEIYLSDPRRTAPEKLKTILRQPVTLEAMK
ncbi:MAG: hypothetical protein FJ134_12120 [Deltaproteobacteria bacterium]|nr:hypothetical protein [Deltaproteobacteria bacterium]